MRRVKVFGSAATSKLTRPFRGADIVPMASSLLKGPFTVEAYQRLGELGILHQDDRVELVAGQVVEMTPIGDRHASCVRRLINLFAPNLRDVAVLDAQNPIVLGSHDAPQPDLTLLHRRAASYATHPRAADVLLVVEVADTSLSYDREIKIPRYAAAGIPEAWLVDQVGDAVGVCRRPGPNGYGEIVMVTRGATLRPLLLPGVAVGVADILG